MTDTIAVGDIHGRFDLYTKFLDSVRDSGNRVILLGDLIDRGPQDMEVLNRTEQLMEDPESWGLASFTAIRGNHEHMFLDSCEGRYIEDWYRNGGDVENLDKMIVHYNWIKNLPLYITVGDTLFSHAGVCPGEDPEVMMRTPRLRETFVWNRGSFLQMGPCFEYWNPNLKRAVFGHTPKFEGPDRGQPYRIQGGVCLDSGAYFTGRLTSYNTNTDTFHFFTDNA